MPAAVDVSHPGELLLRENVAIGRKTFRIVEASGGDIDFVRPIAMLVRQRSAARATKRAIRGCVRLVTVRLPLFEPKFRGLYGDPRHRLCARGSPAIRAMAIRLIQHRTVRAEAHPSAITTAGDEGSLFHLTGGDCYTAMGALIAGCGAYSVSVKSSKRKS